MFCVVNYLSVLSQKSDAFADHIEVLLKRDTKDADGMEIPRFADDRDDRRLGCDQRLHPWIVVDRDAASTGHSKGANLALAQCQRTDFLKKQGVLFVGERIATLNHVNAHFCEPNRDVKFVLE